MKIIEIRIGNCFEYKGNIIKFAIEDFTEADNNSQFLKIVYQTYPINRTMVKGF